MKLRLLTGLLLAISIQIGCTKKLEELPKSNLHIKVDLSKLQIPSTATPILSNIQLLFYRGNGSAWRNGYTYKITDLSLPIKVDKAAYNNVTLTAMVSYEINGANTVVEAIGYMNGKTDGFNFINDDVTASFPLDKKK